MFCLLGARSNKGSNQDVRRREQNKRMQEIKQQGPRLEEKHFNFFSSNYEKQAHTVFSTEKHLTSISESLIINSLVA